MTRFMLLYRGTPTDMSAMSQDEAQAEMGRWMAWYGQQGDAVLDMGSPFATSTSVVDDGSRTGASSLTGYTVVEAADLDAVASMVNDHPYLRDGGGEFSVDVFEMVDMEAP